MLHKPAELLSFDLFILVNEGLNRVDIALKCIESICLNLIFAGSAILLAKEATLSSMHLVKLVTVHVVRCILLWLGCYRC